MRSALALCTLAALLGASAAAADRPIGRGADQVWVLPPLGSPGAVVVFLHGWADLSPDRAWIAHLRSRGDVVVFPRYQLDVSDASTATVAHLRNGLRLAFARPGLRRLPVVVVGHSWGATLAFRYAVSARAWSLPVPRAVMSVFPASLAYGGPPAARLPASVRVLLLAEQSKPTLLEAYRDWLGSTRARTRISVVPGAGHGDPGRTDRAARRTYWAPLDALVARVG